MQLKQTGLDGLVVITPNVIGDSRGWFMESWSAKKFADLGLEIAFVQDNHSYSERKGILRGLHFQKEPYAQTKLVRCTRGKVLDVAVDLRRGSPTYLKWFSIELSAENHHQLLVPKGFAHGFLTLSDDVELQYKVDAPYSKECDRSIRFDDPEIGVDWGIRDPQLSEKDQKAPLLADSDCDFVFRREV